MSDTWMGEPEVIDPPNFCHEAAWKECRDYVDQCGGLSNEDGSPNWRAAFGADPGCCSCPACGAMYWAWGRKQRCKRCQFEYESDWWPMYSYGARAGLGQSVFGSVTHERRLYHPYYRYGFEHPTEKPWADRDKIDWRSVFPPTSGAIRPPDPTPAP